MTPNASLETLESAGSILRAAREAKGIPVELVAHDLRMRTQQVFELEEDNYARLPHTSYVRLLILYYAKYLGVPSSQVEPHLPERWNFQSGGYQAVCHLLPSGNSVRMRPGVEFSSLPNRTLPAVATCCIFLLLLILGGYFYFNSHRARAERNAISPSVQTAAVSDVENRTGAIAMSAFDSAWLEETPRTRRYSPIEEIRKIEQSSVDSSTVSAPPQPTPNTVISTPSRPNSLRRH